MRAAFTVTELNDMAEYGNHQIVILFFFVNLVSNYIGKSSLFCVKGNSILDAALNYHHFKRSVDIIYRPKVKGFCYKISRVFRRNNYNRQVLYYRVKSERARIYLSVFQEFYGISEKKKTVLKPSLKSTY